MTAIARIQPEGFSVIEWTDYMNDSLSQFGPVPLLQDSDDWQSWAAIVCGLPGISQQQPPSPYGYSEWIPWANAFNQTMQLEG